MLSCRQSPSVLMFVIDILPSEAIVYGSFGQSIVRGPVRLNSAVMPSPKVIVWVISSPTIVLVPIYSPERAVKAIISETLERVIDPIVDFHLTVNLIVSECEEYFIRINLAWLPAKLSCRQS